MKDMKLILGDCLEVMKDLEDNSVDSIVTDPPYGLSFMGKKWDYDVPSVKMWQECLRVLKPGGFLLSFGGTRTHHRMACAIEDAGFEIRDMIAWVYGSGFPKSLNIGKAVDKLEGNEREEFERTDGAGNKQDYLESDRTKSEAGVFGGDKQVFIDSKGTSEYEGWGTALKPALEPITVARKPLSEKTVAENVLKWGTGGINIDECRVEYQSGNDKHDYPNGAKGYIGEAKGTVYNSDAKNYDRTKPYFMNNTGRFPANLIHDGSDEVVELFPNTGKAGNIRETDGITAGNSMFGIGGIGKRNPKIKNDNGGSASRFFYCAKASKSERNRGCEGLEEKLSGTNAKGYVGDGIHDIEPRNVMNRNNHPTVKPISLMRYLCKLITPPKGTCLDPFMGSGSTGIAAKLEGFNFIGIEREPDYLKITEARIEAWKQEAEQDLLL